MTLRPRRPLSPEAAAVLRAGHQLSQHRVSRRGLLAGAGGLGLGAGLAGCGTGGTSTGGASASAAGPTAATDRSATEKVVNWANWTLYLDYDEATKTYPTLQEFTKKTGIKANYSEDIDDNESYYGKIQAQLAIGQDIGQDIVVFTDWMANRVIRQGYVQELDLSQIPNSDNILGSLKNVGFDPGRKHSLTWQSGYAGLAWNKKAFPKGMTSLQDLWKPELKGKVEVLSEMRDTLGLIMLDQGVDISKDFTATQFDSALAVLKDQLDSGQIRQVKGNSYKEDLISGDALAVIGWSGDITQINFENGDQWGFAIPDAGGTLWSDNMLVPIGSPHKKNAEILMNYYYDPKVAAEVAAYVNYICPVKGAQEAMKAIDPSLAKDPLIFPTDADLAKVKVFRSLTPAEETSFVGKFQQVLGL